MTWLYDIFSRQ